MSSTSKPSRPILVLGFGIIGLTSAIRLLQAGYHVVAVGAHQPGDPLTAIYSSTAAGAHHLSFAADDDLRQQALDKRTFDVMWEEEAEEGDASALMKLRQVEFYGSEGVKHIKFYESMPDVGDFPMGYFAANIFKKFRVHPQDELKPFAKHSVSFTSLTMDTSPYLAKLVKIFHNLGGSVHRATLASLRDALEFTKPQTPLAIINCTGLGSLKLGDVLDDEMYPIRGQVVILDAPWIKEGRTKQMGDLAGGEGGDRTYIIPRRSGQVIIGGTREVDDWYAACYCYTRVYLIHLPRNYDAVPETSLDIKKRALEIYPELVPPHLRVESRAPVPEDLDSIVIRDVVGFRPARKSGLRLERGKNLEIDTASIPVFHNIGHSGAGWQASWGCAEEIVKLVDQVTT